MFSLSALVVAVLLYLPLIVPHLFASAFYTFLLRQFLLQVPKDMLDAARVAASEAECSAEVRDTTYQPADHPHMLNVPESLYLKSILLQKE